MHLGRSLIISAFTFRLQLLFVRRVKVVNCSPLNIRECRPKQRNAAYEILYIVSDWLIIARNMLKPSMPVGTIPNPTRKLGLLRPLCWAIPRPTEMPRAVTYGVDRCISVISRQTISVISPRSTVSYRWKNVYLLPFRGCGTGTLDWPHVCTGAFCCWTGRWVRATAAIV